MRNDLLFFAKQPYLTGTILVIWLGATVLLVNDPELPVFEVVLLNMLLSIFIIVRGAKK